MVFVEKMWVELVDDDLVYRVVFDLLFVGIWFFIVIYWVGSEFIYCLLIGVIFVFVVFVMLLLIIFYCYVCCRWYVEVCLSVEMVFWCFMEESFMVGLWVCDYNGWVFYVNNVFCCMIGFL